MTGKTPTFDDPRLDYSTRMRRLRAIIACAQRTAHVQETDQPPHPYWDAELAIIRAQRDMARLELDRIRPLLYDAIAPEG